MPVEFAAKRMGKLGWWRPATAAFFAIRCRDSQDFNLAGIVQKLLYR